MRSSKLGISTSASVEAISRFGLWLLVRDQEFFLDFEEFPYFRNQTIGAVQNVQVLHGDHLYWPELDIDLELDNLVNPEKYPLKSKVPPPEG
ncbi:MAG: DUF2442 domain-containing protein [Candidatus Riflebacteria bacterium]|nr:DUF2442 domain-containing protein [Candidatus Riflebacteria bacterium]